jgi:hypothetical protein
MSLKNNSGIDISYEEYKSLLRSAALSYDTQFRSKHHKSLVFLHDIITDDDDPFQKYEHNDIDTEFFKQSRHHL